MNEQIQKFLGNPTVSKALIILIGISVIWLIIKILQKRLFSKIEDNDTQYRVKKFSGFIGYFLTIILFAVVFSDKLGGFTMALGVAGAGIAFALQEVIVSVAGWIAILFGGFYKSGDRVQLGGIKGDVMDIGVLRTTIMETGQWVGGDLYNGRIVLIANSFVFKEPVFNYSGDFPFLWDEIKLPIQFGSDYEKTKEILLKVGKEIAGDLTNQSHTQWLALQDKYLLEDAKTEPMVSLIVNDNWVEFTLRYVVSYKKRRAMKTDLFTHLLKEIEAPNSGIKFASATFQIVDGSEIKVKVQ
jgi:small-conductance mechanosensitive channel